ncbi:ABC transporter permease [Aquimarina sp. 2201CG5-10]|uniref:ABC transporter permease n=1 Tax=Aquimarina callyspongiae TaxID=3098150 RepID=UPI002AB5B243|nr:ABC transporter permease [Aquimarina sp. 2201CG5-10]MDY8137531.1 ABC transporter permease [Aquimarina sp. 2201CG5-10]
MYNLYLKIAIRYLRKNKLYSFINIAGLVIGMFSFILISLYVNNELSYDKFDNSENVYRVYMDYLEGDNFVPGDAQTYNLTGPSLKKEFPEIQEYTRTHRFDKVTFTFGDKTIEETKGCLADQSYFDIFKYPLLKGNPDIVLKDPYSIVLTESLSEKIFGTENPIGKTLSVYYAREEAVVKVTGIAKDTPENTHAKTNFFISFNTLITWDAFLGQQKPNWSQNNFFTYIKVDKNTNIALLKEKIMNSNLDGKDAERHNIEPLEDIHLYSNKPYEAETNGSISRVRFLSAIAFIILILSWFNYINLSSTKSLERAKEIGIRKVVGAQKKQLIIQLLLESILINFLAIGIAIVLSFILLPVFNNYTGKSLFLQLSDVKRLLPIVGFIVVGILLAGLYPALLVSNYNPTKALKGKIRTSAKGLNVRKGLVIAQFMATITLLIGTIVVTKQINFLEKQPIGTNLNQVIALHGEIISKKEEDLLKADFNILRTELEKFSFIKQTSTAETFPGDGYDLLSSFIGITYPNGIKDDKKMYHQYQVHPDYFDLLDIKFMAGKAFSLDGQNPNYKIVVNEKFIQEIGIPEASNAIDKKVKFFGKEWTISGVMRNYHHFSLKNVKKPMIIRYGNANSNLLVKLDDQIVSTSGIQNTIVELKNAWNGVFPQSTFKYTFLDQKFKAQYLDDAKFGDAFKIFTILAICIAVLGLFGLTSYTCIQRKKEIGIRKVSGATVFKILALLNKDFLKWILIAFILSIPLSWYVMNIWLENFALKTPISWWIFATAGIAVLLITLLTVSAQAFKTAIANPIYSLRTE